MDNPAWMIPYVTRLLLEGGKPSLTKAEQVWDYIYVEDVASAILAVLETSNATGLFNLGSGKAVALRLIIEKIRERINSNLPLGFGDLPYRSDQVMHLEADITRLTNVTGWLPNVTLDTGLRKTIDWYAQA
jgi:nucleoside-diphosphate-sugar epimerase